MTAVEASLVQTEPPLHAAPGVPSPDFLKAIDHEFARRHLVLSAGVRDGVEHLLAAETTKPLVLFNIGVRLGRAVAVHERAPEDLALAIDRAYAAVEQEGESATSAALVVEGSDDLDADLLSAVRDAERDLLSTHGKAPAVRLVDLILFEALCRGASDVHLQPLRDRTLVRYRLNGSLHTMRELPASVAAGITSRIKVMASLDVAERRTPQDGRASVLIGHGSRSSNEASRQADLRISTLPSVYGERVVLRLLDPSRSPHLSSFAGLGMPPEVERGYLAQIARASGIVLSTGPTGSGKTTSLYASLAWISSTNAGGTLRGCELNIVTVEDPVEYDLSGAGLAISQTQVDVKKQVTFATGLRHILRQDPDVIMVGEIRDEETARIAVQASLTGHLVLSTLHTSDSASAIARLLDLGVEPFLVASSLSAVLAQRLVRRTHVECQGRGCETCLHTGFHGRTGVFELLVIDSEVRTLIGERASAVAIAQRAQSRGMRTLRQAGLDLVRQGVTTLEELTRVIDATEEVEM